jgi:phosphoglucosamine mutase
VVFAKTTFPRDLSLEGMRVVVDAAHGAAYRVAPLVFQELGATVTAIGVKPNGVNINRDAGALHPDNVRAEVVKRGAQIGIALDGDADRVLVVDEAGQIVDGDAVMAMCATRMIRDRELRNGTVVATVMSNLGLERALERLGARLLRTPVGDRYVVEAMRQGGYNLGGEQSGHLLFLDHTTTGDGINAALQVLALMMRTGQPLSELARSAMERVPQVLESISLPKRRPLADMTALAQVQRQVESALGSEGRVLVRWSGTEPKLRIMLEGPDERRLRDWSKELAEAAARDVAVAS